MVRHLRFGALLVSIFAVLGCTSAYRQIQGGDPGRSFSRIYVTDFNTSWQGVLDSLKSLRLDVSNREGGFLQTRWTDNTAEKRLVESYGAVQSYLKSQFRFRVSVAKGFYNGQPSIKVVVQKDQMIERDVLEGWRPIETDGIEEHTLLYRIGRLITIRTKLARIEEEKAQEELDMQDTAPDKQDTAPDQQEAVPNP